MDVRYCKVVEQLNQTQLAVEDSTCRGTLLALALGLAISRSISLPSSAVQEPDDFFNTSIQEIRRHISGFNENMVFDMREAEQMVRAMWMIRYNAMYPRQYPLLAFQGQSFTDALMGVGNVLSPAMTEFANKYAMPIFLLSNVCAEVLSGLN